jgi:pyruvate/2-oxoglutarate dehydrogenase complex dihydrolipoamide acyltransferase (E2) component
VNLVKKHFLIAATAAALLLPSLSSAILAAPREKATEHQQLEAEHTAAFTDARIAALKAGLKLTSAQEKNWPALETTLREVAKDRATRTAEWNEKAKEHREKRDLIEGFRLGAKNLSARGAELEKIADAAKPLYDSLDDGQKHRFSVLLHEVFKHHDHHMHWGMHPDEHSDEDIDTEHQE